MEKQRQPVQMILKLCLGLSLTLGTLLLLAERPFTASAQSGTLAYLPYISTTTGCSGSSQSYSTGFALQFDLDNPVRLAEQHADKNFDLRGYAPASGNFKRELVNYGSDDPTQPPQFATLFKPNKVPQLVNFYGVYSWNWASSPNPGSRSGLDNGVKALGLRTTPGEPLYMPSSGYDIGGGQEGIVLYADEDTIALRFTREDSSGAAGYTMHVDGICVNPNLLALYRSLDNSSGPRYVYRAPSSRPYSYDLPALKAGQQLGTADGTEIVVAIVDSGAFMDPRSCNEWWQIRPGYGGSCPAP